MSLIKIQATRDKGSTPGSVLTKNREAIEKTGLENKSSTPIYVGMLLLSLGLYLKSSLVGKSFASIPPEDSLSPEEENSVNEATLTELASLGRGLSDKNKLSDQNDQHAAKIEDAESSSIASYSN